MTQPAPLDVLAKVKSCGSKAGREEYDKSFTLTCADVEVVRHALRELDAQQKRGTTPAEDQLVQLKGLVLLADRLLRDPTSFWATGGWELWAKAIKEARDGGLLSRSVPGQ